MTVDEALVIVEETLDMQLTQTKLLAAEVRRLRETLSNLRSAAERYMRDHEPGYGAPAFREAIEASKT